MKNPSPRKIFLVFFKVNIPSSDLHEFWIGQKILKAETLLLNLSTTFIGLGVDKWSQTPHTVQDTKKVII